MSKSKHIDKICIAVFLIIVLLTLIVVYAVKSGMISSDKDMGYENRLFNNSTVHTIDIVMNDWDSFISNCESEEYSNCTVLIDGEKFNNVGLRAKGNTSLSNVKSMDSTRYSLKVEFDQYEEGKSYYGLDKLCLNNLIQDNTMMKDYLTYQMMADFGVDAPLCSYAYITVNGEDWGLYLAVEGVEDSFLSRNYGSDTGEIYKPDSMSFGGGKGNGKDFDMKDFENKAGEDTENKPEFSGPGGDNFQNPGSPGGMGSDDVKLKYIDDDLDSYSKIFDSAKTEITKEDKKRLVSSLKSLSEYEDLEDTLDMDEVLRYFVIHNFVVNGDSYTGSMIHNYYLHEKDGKLGMIPWDYNLAFGTFQGGNSSESVNASIDGLVSDGDVNDRPMFGWIFSNNEYTEMYHEIYDDFVSEWIENGKLNQLISDTYEMIKPYVEKDPTKFCTSEEFEKGVNAISEFITLRGDAVRRQLNNDDTLVATDSLNVSDMGTMDRGDKEGEMPNPDRGDFKGNMDRKAH